MDYIITHYPDNKRFETQVDGVVAFVQYRLSGDKLDIIHTIVPPAIGGRGIAAALVKYAYDYAIENSMKPSATCSYAVIAIPTMPDEGVQSLISIPSIRISSNACKEETEDPLSSLLARFVMRIPDISEFDRSIPFKDVW